ncbi:MAG: hypothetical protein ACKESB_03125, partial [Candidatus Hodgkinia cicadicola]
MTSICKTAIKISKTEEAKRLIEGELVWGTIKYKNDSFMLVDIGFKTEARVQNLGTWNYGRFKTGQLVQVYVDCLASAAEEALASRRQLDIDEAWAEAALAQASAAWVEGTIVGCTTEGFVISVFGLPALLPFKLINKWGLFELTTRPTTNVRLLEVDKSRNHISLIKPADEDADDGSEPRIWDSVWGVVRGISERSISIDLGWCRGVLTLSNEMWYDALTFAKLVSVGSVVATLYGGMSRAEAEPQTTAEGDEVEGERLDWEGDSSEDSTSSEGDESDGGGGEEVAMLFLERSEDGKKEDIVYGIVEEVTEQTVMLRMSPSLTQHVEAAAFEAATDEAQATQHESATQSVAVGDVVKVVSVCLSLADKLVLLNVDVEGARYLKFVEANIEFVIEGLISEIESNYAIVALDYNVFGKLEISDLQDATSEETQVENWRGCTVTVEICDFCPETNTIYL